MQLGQCSTHGLQQSGVSEERSSQAMSVCAECNGTLFVHLPQGGVRECHCRAAVRLAGMIARSGLPERYEKASFASFEVEGRSPSVHAMLRTAQAYCAEFPTDRSRGLLMSGTVGVGKTHLAISIIRKLTIDYGARCYFTDFRELLNRLKDSFGGQETTRKEILRPIYEADVVVIDELGAARVTDWTYEVAEEIINTRYNSAKATIFTTNLPNRDKMAPAPRGGYGNVVTAELQAETLAERLGARMFSRLQEMCKPIDVTGDDYRRKAR